MTVSGERADVLEGGRRPAVPRRSRIIVGAGLAMVLLAGLWWEHRDAVSRYQQLLRCVSAAESVLTQSHQDLTLASNSVVLGVEPDLATATRLRLFRPIATAAAASVPGLEQAQRRCQRMQPRPWADGQQRAKAAYLMYLDSEIAVARAISANGESSFVQHPGLEQEHAVAVTALARAAPTSGLRRAAAQLQVRLNTAGST